MGWPSVVNFCEILPDLALAGIRPAKTGLSSTARFLVELPVWTRSQSLQRQPTFGTCKNGGECQPFIDTPAPG